MTCPRSHIERGKARTGTHTIWLWTLYPQPLCYGFTVGKDLSHLLRSLFVFSLCREQIRGFIHSRVLCASPSALVRSGDEEGQVGCPPWWFARCPAWCAIFIDAPKASWCAWIALLSNISFLSEGEVWQPLHPSQP